MDKNLFKILFPILIGTLIQCRIQNSGYIPGSPNSPLKRSMVKTLPRTSQPYIEGLSSHSIVSIPLPPRKPDTMASDVPGEPLSPADFLTAKAIENHNPDLLVKPDPIELAGLYEGDIEPHSLPQEVQSSMPRLRSAVKDPVKMWPNGVIPYALSSAYSQIERAVIAKAIAHFHEKTCIRFVPRIHTHDDYIHILKGDGCSSSVGRIGGAQQLSLGDGCVYDGIVVHELMHAIGFWHEQSRMDRDNFIEIIWNNIQEGMDSNFQMRDQKEIKVLGAYDTGSLMHYGPYAFTKDRSKPTIIARNGDAIGQRNKLSEMDLQKIMNHYQCSNTTMMVTESPVTTGSPGVSCVDSHEFCVDWAKSNECSKNPLFMDVYCMKSCNTCDKECQDHSPFCEYWSKRDECMKNPSYMQHFCKKSCGLCHPKNPIFHDEAVCEDKNRYCKSWSTSDECRVNQNYMLKYCRKSCNKC